MLEGMIREEVLGIRPVSSSSFSVPENYRQINSSGVVSLGDSRLPLFRVAAAMIGRS